MHPYIREYFRRLRLCSWNRREQRLRALPRVCVFIVLHSAVFIAIPTFVVITGSELVRSASLRLLLVGGTVGLVVGVATQIDKRPVREYGLDIDRDWMTDLFVGFVIGGTIPAGAVTLGVVGGWIGVAEVKYVLTDTFLRDIGLALVVVTSIAVVEELVFRGYVLTNAIEGLRFRWIPQPVAIATAWGISAVVFAFVHPAPTLVGGFYFVGAGLLLGLAYLLTGQLGLPIGIHAGFNFVSGYVFPLGSDLSVTVVSLSVSGPTWLTGQTGFVHTALLLLAALALLGGVWIRTGGLGIDPRMRSKLR